MSETTVFVRKARLSDLEAVMRIENESFLSGLREEKELYRKRMNVFQDGFLVAEDSLSGQVVGYICGELWSEEQGINAEVLSLGHDPADVHDENGKHLYITSFGILRNRRGRKTGLKLFSALEEKITKEYPNVVKMILIVSERWTAARNLYFRQGLKETGRIIDFFTPDGLPAEDAVIMMKPLTPQDKEEASSF